MGRLYSCRQQTNYREIRHGNEQRILYNLLGSLRLLMLRLLRLFAICDLLILRKFLGFAMIVRCKQLPKWRPSSFIDGATDACRYGCLLLVWAGIFYGVGKNISVGDVLVLSFSPKVTIVEASAVASEDAATTTAPPPTWAPDGTLVAPMHQWPARQPDGTRWGWQPDGATGCHPFCTPKHCSSRADCASCVVCLNRTKELPWAAVADHARHHGHATASPRRGPSTMNTERYATMRRGWNVTHHTPNRILG